mmetsp:Transcript_4547/g.6330  ORF Transcript_4547/g.6330 Transcript_4547/m.6330 type:complete len:166 (-) Transcript_4547:1993-2490(-)
MPTRSKKPAAAVVEKKKKRKNETAKDESSGPPKKKKRVRKKCSETGCPNQVKRAGVCVRHGANRQPQAKEKEISIDSNIDDGSAALCDETESSPSKKGKNTKTAASTKCSSAASTKASKDDSTAADNGIMTKKSTYIKKTTKNSSQQTCPTWEEMFYKLILFQAD